MEDFEDYGSEYKKVDDQVMFLYLQLMNIPYHETDIINEIKQSLYTEMAGNPDDNLFLIAFMQAETMLGNHEKGKAFAYKIWERGSTFHMMEEYLYINNLLNLGLLDMASTLLKPKLENLMEEIEDYYAILLKVAVMTGNILLMERIASNPSAPERDGVLLGLINRYKAENYVDKFKTVQKIMLENTKENLCAFEYEIMQKNGGEIAITLYINGDDASVKRINTEIMEKLNVYYKAIRLQKIPNYSWRVIPVRFHPSENLGSKKDYQERV